MNKIKSINKSITTTLIVAGVIAITICSIGLYLLIHSMNSLLIKNRALSLTSAIQIGSDVIDSSANLQRMISYIGGERDVKRIFIVAANPRKVIMSKSMSENNSLLSKYDKKIGSIVSESILAKSLITSESNKLHLLSFAMPLNAFHFKKFYSSDENFTLFVEIDTSQYHASANNVWLITTGIFALFISLFVVINYIKIRHKILIPVNQIKLILNQIKEKPFTEIAGAGAGAGEKNEITDLLHKLIELNSIIILNKEKSDHQQAALTHSSRLASLGEMSAGIAHEINNPLAIISGSAKLLSKFKDNPEKFASKIESIQKCCDRIAKIVSGLKKFSRSSDEKRDFETHSISDIINEATVLTDNNSKSQSTPVTIECSTQAKILCVEVEIEQVLVNLINNGIDAVKDRPEKWIKISIFEEGHTAVVRVMDSGLGIPKSISAKLFDPFFTTKKVGEGTGLGLSISKGILDEHNATITVVADCPNTCFEIRFPKAEEMKNAA